MRRRAMLALLERGHLQARVRLATRARRLGRGG
jgi:hypothetical protein